MQAHGINFRAASFCFLSLRYPHDSPIRAPHAAQEAGAADKSHLSYDLIRQYSRYELRVEHVTKRLAIEGLVQGVGFRYFMQRKARALGVTGWVRNRADGSVEAIVQGSAKAVEDMIGLARQGPTNARVATVSVSDADGQFTGFDQRPTE